jgi:hypothetical protein
MSRLVLNIEPDEDGVRRLRLPSDGSYLILDEGSLDVGCLRLGDDGNFHEAPYDPSEWKVFHETFENVAFVGTEDLTVQSKPER